MNIPSSNVPAEFEYNTREKDQEKAIELAAQYGMAQKWELVSIFWIKADENGHHIFNIIYNPA